MKRGIILQIFENFPETELGKQELLDNLGTFKAELLLKSIENLNVSDKTKEEVLKKVFEILDKNQDDVI